MCKMLAFWIKGPVIITSQLKFIYNSPFKDWFLHSIHTCLPIMVASNELSSFLEDMRGCYKWGFPKCVLVLLDLISCVF